MGIEGRSSDTGSEVINTSFDILTQSNNALERRVDSLETQAHADTPRTVGTVVPAVPFVIKQEPHVKGMRVTVGINFPPARSIEFIKAVYRHLLDTAADNIEEEWSDIPDTDAASGHHEPTFKEFFDYGETFVLKALIIKGDFANSGKERNPNPPNDATTLATFIIDQQFGAPSAPSLGSIIENKLDDTTKAFDAFIVVQIIAPATSSLVASGTAAITNNSTTINGTGGAYLSQVAIGRGVTVAGETHIVTSVPGNNTIIVDQPFKQTLSGQSLTVSVLKTWGEIEGIKRVVAKFRLFDDVNARPVTEGHTFTSDELAQTEIKFRVNGFIAARKYIYRRNVVVSAVSENDITSVGTITFIAGGFTDATALIPEITSPTFRYDVTEPLSAGKERNTSVIFTQPNPCVALYEAECRVFKRLTGLIQLTISGSNVVGSGGSLFLTELAPGHLLIAGSQTLQINTVTNNALASLTTSSGANYGPAAGYACAQEPKQVINLARARYHPVTGGVISPIVWGLVKTKKLLNHIFRMTIFAQNGFFRHIDDNFTSDSTGEIDGDSAAPGAPPAPELQEFFGALKCEADLPSTNINTFKKYRYVMSTQATAPSSITNPTVGVDGVLKIKKSTGAVEFQRKQGDISSTTFYFYVQALNQIDWGPWSPPTSILGSVITRPLTDVIGNAAPKARLRLERNGTSQTGHGVAQFQIDAGASSVDDFYNGMFLHVPSLPANNRVRKITDYDGASRTCQVAGYITSAPAGALAFEIHAGIEDAGDTSQTGHDTTHLVLASTASAVDGAYTGMSIYVPNQAAGDQIRKIIGYVGATRKVEFESAVAVASSGNVGYMISKMSFGFAAINPASGIITGVPIRVWLNTDSGTNQIEVEMPVGENAFSVQAVFGEGYRNSNGKLRATFELGASSTPSIAIPVPSATFYWRVRFQNLVREDGSGGFSAWSHFVEGYGSGATPGQTYDPSVFTPVSVDFQDEDSYPTQRYPQF